MSNAENFQHDPHLIHLIQQLERKMATVDNQLAGLSAAISSLNTAVASVATAVQAIAKPEDLTPVVNGLAALQTTVNAIAAKLPIDQPGT